MFLNASVSNERRSSYCGRVAAQFPLYSLFSSEVTGPIFTKLLHDVEALVILVMQLMHAYTKRQCIPFWNATAKSEGSQL